MGAWDDLALDNSTLKGMAPADLQDPDYGEFDTQRKSTDTVQNAKDYIVLRLAGAAPQLMATAPTPEAFMDAAITTGAATDLIQQLLGRAFLYHYYQGERFSNSDVYEFKKQEQKMLLDEALQAVTAYLLADEDFLTQLETTSETGLDKYNDVIFVC